MISQTMVHSATLLAPIAHLLAFGVYRSLTRQQPSDALPSSLIREERSLPPEPHRLVLLSLLWPGLGLLNVGEQFFGLFSVGYQILLLALYALEVDAWQKLALASIFLNYILSLGVVFEIHDRSRRDGATPVIRIRR